jgi:heat-inducible transcriptional repressor
MNQVDELTGRQKTILFAIVKEFCETGIAPGSQELAETYSFSFSPATIRNEMSILRSQGYLYQPFTNSSSQPTEQSLKLFIVRLMEGLQVSSAQQHKLRERISVLQNKQMELSKEIAKLIADQGEGIGFALSDGTENIKGMSNLLKSSEDEPISDILTFLDNIDTYRTKLLTAPHESDVNNLTMLIGDENPIMPLGRGYALVTTVVELENGEKSVVGMITKISHLTKKKNLQLMQSLSTLFSKDDK